MFIVFHDVDAPKVRAVPALDGTGRSESKCPRCRHSSYIHELVGEDRVVIEGLLEVGRAFTFACPQQHTDCGFSANALAVDDETAEAPPPPHLALVKE